MKLTIDISVFVSDICSWGRVSGPVDFLAVPVVGSTVSFISGKDGVSVPCDFPAELKVETVLIRPNVMNESGVVLMLEDLVLESIEQAGTVTEYLREAFDLFVEKYEVR